MAWSQALSAPPAYNLSKGKVTASIWNTKRGVRLRLGLRARVWEEVGRPKCGNAWMGDGDEAGQVLLQFDEEGELPARIPPKGGATFSVILPAGMKRDAQKLRDCAYEVQEGEGGVKQLVVILPADWFTTKLKRAA